MALYKTGSPVPSSAMPDVWDNNRVQDEIINSEELEVESRTGKMLPTWAGVVKTNADAIEDTRQNLIPLSRQYMTLADAQADIANIPDGSTTYVRSPDGGTLADEYINNGGTLTATGRHMPSQESVDFTLSSAGQLPSAIMTREEIFASVERYGQWTRTDTNGWAVGVKSSGKPVNSLSLWLNNLSEISTLSVSVYHRTADSFSVFPGADNDKLLSSRLLASGDVAITQALAQGYQLVRLTVPDVLLKSDEIILFVVKALDATGNPVYMGCGRAPVESGQVSDLNNSLGGYWLDVAQTTWKTITSADSLYRLAYRVCSGTLNLAT